LVAIIAFILSRREEEIQNYKLLTAREMLETHFKFKTEGKENFLGLTVHESRRNTIWELKNIRHLNIISIEEMGYEFAQEYIATNDFHEMDSFIVEYEIKFWITKQQNNGTYEMCYVLIKESENSPWLVYTWGVNLR